MEPIRGELIVVLSYLCLFCLVGSVGNAIVIYVTAYMKEPIVSRHFIITLAVVDLMTCVIVIPMTVYVEYAEHMVNYELICKLYQFLITSNVPFSVFVILAIAVERCVAICQPHWTIISYKIIISVLAVTSISLGTIVAITYDTKQELPLTYIYSWLMTDASDNETVTWTLCHGSTNWLTTQAGTGNSLVSSKNELFPMSNEEMKFSLIKQLKTTINWHTTSTINRHDTSTNSLLSQPPVEATTCAALEELLRERAVHLLSGEWRGDNLYVRTGECQPNDVFISWGAQWYFQKFYCSLYIVSFILVMVFYSLICRTVLARHRRRQSEQMLLLRRDREPSKLKQAMHDIDEPSRQTCATQNHQEPSRQKHAQQKKDAPPQRHDLHMNQDHGKPTSQTLTQNTFQDRDKSVRQTHIALTIQDHDKLVRETFAPHTHPVQVTSLNKLQQPLVSLSPPSPARVSVTLFCEDSYIKSFNGKDSVLRQRQDADSKRSHKKKQKMMNAQIKAAAMLFVVTMVLWLTYIPAFLMTVDLLPYSMPVFYLYFLNFAVNPIIYSFMNSRFRKVLRSIICCRKCSKLCAKNISL